MEKISIPENKKKARGGLKGRITLLCATKGFTYGKKKNPFTSSRKYTRKFEGGGGGGFWCLERKKLSSLLKEKVKEKISQPSRTEESTPMPCGDVTTFSPT